MHRAVASPFLVPFDRRRVISDYGTTPPDTADTEGLKKRLRRLTSELYDLQKVLYAQDEYSVLLIFQAMDAAGKDGTIRAVMTGVNPAGCQVFSFKKPSAEELDHDFLWRTARRLPERGRIGIFNRSYYEEVLSVRVHPEFLDYQRIPDRPPLEEIWPERLASITSHERHLASNGTIILKFWLNVSKEEQARRFLDRIDDPSKNWKFNEGDLTERALWNDYMDAFEDALTTSRPWAPWYAIPADSKTFMRLAVAEIIVKTLQSLPLAFPHVDGDERARLGDLRDRLINED